MKEEMGKSQLINVNYKQETNGNSRTEKQNKLNEKPNILFSRLDTAKEKINECEYMSIETIQIIAQKVKNTDVSQLSCCKDCML